MPLVPEYVESPTLNDYDNVVTRLGGMSTELEFKFCDLGNKTMRPVFRNTSEHSKNAPRSISASPSHTPIDVLVL